MIPKISIIVPVYKAVNFISRCAHSLFRQTLEDMQFIFVDDCSPDDSIEKLQEVISCYPLRKAQVSIIRHSYNKGVSAARNTGLEYAIGEFVAYCDSDDFVDITMYQKLYDKASQTNSDVVMCDFSMYYSEQEKCDIQSIKVTDWQNSLRAYIGYGWTIISNIIAKRSLYYDYKISFPENRSYCEDFYVNFKLLFYSKIISKVDDCLYYYDRSNIDSAMHSLNTKADNDERQIYLELIEFLKKEGKLSIFEEQLSWRVLKNKQDMCLYPEKHHVFMEIYPESHKYIYSCPLSFCNFKVKVFMWLLTHRLRWVLLGLLRLRVYIKK